MNRDGREKVRAVARSWPTLRTRTRIALALASCVWAAVLVAAGLGTLTSLRPGGLSGLERLGTGVAMAAAGQFVFLVLVADRLFPRANRRLVIVAEAVVFALFLAGLASAALGVLNTGSPA
jgi:hypothetical protein